MVSIKNNNFQVNIIFNLCDLKEFSLQIEKKIIVIINVNNSGKTLECNR